MLLGRSRDIVNRVDHLGSASVVELAEQFGVAVETIRRDLRALEDEGYLRRIHGGAASLLDNISELTFSSRQSENAASKKRIAQQAARLVQERDVLMLDPSSSCWYLAQELPDMDLTVITNSVRIVFDLVQKPNIKTVCVGGEYSEKYGAFLGAVTVSNILDFQADICFHSCAAFSPETGAWDSNDLNAAVKKSMRRSSITNALLFDDSKMERRGHMLISPPEQIDCLINERSVSGTLKRQATEKNSSVGT